MAKRAFLVLGPESSGTRMMTSFLIAAGCQGDSGHEQTFDRQPPAGESLITWRRSYPYAEEWPDIEDLMKCLDGYQVTAVVMSRDWHSMIISQQQAPHAETVEEAVANIRRAYVDIFAQLAAWAVPYEVANYEAITQRPQTLTYLFQRLGLQPPAVYIYDANAKYYQEALFNLTAESVKELRVEIRSLWDCEVNDTYAKALLDFTHEVADVS